MKPRPRHPTVAPVGPPPAADADAPAVRRYRLEIRPDAPGHPWSAVLVAWPDGVRAEFASPLALLRFITRATGAAPRGGLR